MPTRRQAAAISLDVGDAAELVEMLTFIGDRLDSTDGPALNTSLQRFAHAAYGLTDPQADLARFALQLHRRTERGCGAGVSARASQSGGSATSPG